MRYLAILLLLAGCANAQTIVTLPNGLTPVPAPSFAPVPNTYGSPQSVVISDVQSPSTIIYTTDTSVPSLTNGTQCPAPCTVSISTTVTLSALATASGFGFSNLNSGLYTINTAPTPTPTFSPTAPLTSLNAINVTVNNSNGTAINYCTTDGSTPVVAVSPVCANPVVINTPGVGPVTLKAISKAPALGQSGIQTGVYTYQPAATTPSIAPAQGQYTSFVDVTITAPFCAGQIIYYTTNGNTPTTLSQQYSGAIHITVNSVVQAMQTCPLYAQSLVTVPVSYTIVPPIQTQTPTFQPNGGSSTTSIPFQILDASAGAIIHYTTDGVTTPTSNIGTQCTAPCSLTATVTETVMAVADSSGASTSLVGTATFTVTPVGPQPCPQTAGTLTVNVSNPRVAAVSPFLVFFDATGTTDSSIAANTTTFQGVTYSWNFGDSGSSGSGTWQYGSNPNGNSTNTATGGVAAHVYIIPSGSGDRDGVAHPQFVATVTAQDAAGNKVTCTAPPITVYDRHGTAVSNGGHAYGGTSTTCVAATTLPVKGVGGCPPGAAVLLQANWVTALASIGTGKQVLFNCGDTFTANNATVTGTNAAIGAYGGCEGTGVGLPIFSLAAGNGINFGASSVDWRMSDIDFEGSGVAGGGLAINFLGSGLTYPSQITIANVIVNGVNRTIWGFGGHENALVNLTSTGMGNTDGTFIMQSENQCLNASVAYNCGGTPAYASVDYNAILGSSFNGAGATSGGPWEVVRISAGRKWVIENSTFQNGFNGGAVLKFHSGNPNSQNNWIGQYGELDEISDNLFTGTSGSQLVEIAPQNGQVDERLRNIVFERNYILGVAGANGHCKVIASAMNFTARDNVFNSVIGAGDTFCLQLTQRGAAYGTGGGAPGNTSFPQYNEADNNSFYGTSALGLAGVNYVGPANNSWAINNLFYRTSGANTTVTNTGASNTINNNTSTVTNNPAFINTTGSFANIADFKPTANYGGAVNVPVFYDALGTAWPPTWELGALRHTTASTVPLATSVKFSGCTVEGLIGTIDAGSEATGVVQAGTQLTFFSQYVSLIGRSHCKYIGRAVSTYGWAPNFTAISANITAFKNQLDSNHIFGFYLAEKVWTTLNSNYVSYACTVTFCNGRNFNFGNGTIGSGMCVSNLNNAATQCESAWSNAEYLAYMTQITQSAIDMGFQVFLLGQTSVTDPQGTATGPLVTFMKAMRTYAANSSKTILFIGQHPSSHGGSAYLNSFDLVQGGIYQNPDGTIPNSPIVQNKVGNPGRIWLETGFAGMVAAGKVVTEYDWFSNVVDDSSYNACLSMPDLGYLTYVRANFTGACPLGGTIQRTAVSVSQTIFNYFKNQNLGFWLPGRQRVAFSPFIYSPINLTLAPSTPEAINYNDEGMLQIGNP